MELLVVLMCAEVMVLLLLDLAVAAVSNLATPKNDHHLELSEPNISWELERW